MKLFFAWLLYIKRRFHPSNPQYRNESIFSLRQQYRWTLTSLDLNYYIFQICNALIYLENGWWCLFFFLVPQPRGLGPKREACIHTGRRPPQARRKPTTQVGKKPPQAERGDVPGVQTLGSQVRTNADKERPWKRMMMSLVTLESIYVFMWSEYHPGCRTHPYLGY